MAPTKDLDKAAGSQQRGEDPASGGTSVSPREVEAAVRTLIAWAGDDPDREGLTGTPMRVAEGVH